MSPYHRRSHTVSTPRPASSPRSGRPDPCGPSAGPLFEPLVIEDTADSWGTGHGSYRKVVGRFKPAGCPAVIEQGPIRTMTRSVLTYGKSRLVMDVYAYPSWPVLEFRFRVTWNEERRRLKLSVPTALAEPRLFVEVPGGAIVRPADGEEHVHGRWLVIEGESGPPGQEGALKRDSPRRGQSLRDRHRFERPARPRLQGRRDPPVGPSQLRLLP